MFKILIYSTTCKTDCQRGARLSIGDAEPPPARAASEERQSAPSGAGGDLVGGGRETAAKPKA